jgi:hypothetical protein
MQNKIIAICQIQNEDIFIENVLVNILDFCDSILVADHQSSDRTGEISKRLAKRYPKIQYTCISHPREAHEMIRSYTNSPTWIFPVDGDELYCPDGLKTMRNRILAGEYDAYRQIYGHSMHCVELDYTKKIALGHLSPPCRTVTKLYNFGALMDWSGATSERCHGGTIKFKPGYSEQSNLNLMDLMSWDESPFRLLHTCFLQRSSHETRTNMVGRSNARINPYEIHALSIPKRWFNNLKQRMGFSVASRYKQERYMRGPLVERDVSVFIGQA